VTNSLVMEAVRRHSGRAAAIVHRKMQRGLTSLATIASTAPLIAMFGTIVGIVNSFLGINGDRASAMAAIAERLSWAFAPAALSLFVAIPALWFYRYLNSRIASFNVEMKTASVELVTRLASIDLAL
jgi:biopolymer transport protein TolQ